MPRVPFHYIDLRTFCYETEDEKRVEEALRTFLPDEFDVDRVESTGHHGDRIIVFSARVERANDVRHVLAKIRDLPDFETLLDELDQRVTDNTEFFLRLDKQAAFKGEARRGGGITLRAKVEAYPAKKEAAVENAREALLGDE
ncbi:MULTISPECIES: RNA-binding protein [unclassified Haloferax]|uniref:RNA-binding protein n=1 Tax=unclassified Haloferax TaxID=2625095 RepID=UPI002875A467|nr:MULTISPECIES: RNA-binding protein [unclassified Haloferax]MDS0240152.1 RNA-binding protein [Haloferax sp. S2CR25]MDS0443273.1 RNA-binding protein [Haloferax sp. S2CR25-2]